MNKTIKSQIEAIVNAYLTKNTVLIDRIAHKAWKDGKKQAEQPYSYSLDIEKIANRESKKMANWLTKALTKIYQQGVEDAKNKCMDIVNKEMSSLGWHKYFNDRQEFDPVRARGNILEKIKSLSQKKGRK